MAQLPPGIRFIISFSRDQWYRAFIFILTFLLYASFHLSRKPISIVKGELHSYCTASNDGKVGFSRRSQKARDALAHQLLDNGTDCGWAPFDQDNYQQLLGALDYSFLCAYAIGMYLSGIIGERPHPVLPNLRDAGQRRLHCPVWGRYFYNIHSFGFYVITQIINGLVQTTGWPSVVTCLGNWFGKGRRGLIMGVWNSHTSVGNILGSLIAGYWVSTCWGLSFIVPGAIVAAMGILCFLFLIEHPKDIACSASPASHPRGYENGAHRFWPQKPVPVEERSKPLDPEMQRLLLSDGKHSGHQNHVVVLPADGGGGMAAISFTGALKIPGVIEFSLCLLFAKLVSYTFLFWLPLYITNVDHLDVKKAGELSTLFDVGGIFGGILAGVISDRLEKRASTCGLMLLLAAPTVGPAAPPASSRPPHLRISPPVLPPTHLQLLAQLLSGLWFLGPGVASTPLSAPHSASPPPASCALHTTHQRGSSLLPASTCAFVGCSLWGALPLLSPPPSRLLLICRTPTVAALPASLGSTTPPLITQVPLLFKCLVVCDLGRVTPSEPISSSEKRGCRQHHLTG
uniref:Solute carrier family 37 member 1 n=1 Tax=Bos mutus grunniens TaxID=30521 RepID=A0A8B9Y3Q3_BOSMU